MRRLIVEFHDCLTLKKVFSYSLMGERRVKQGIDSKELAFIPQFEMIRSLSEKDKEAFPLIDFFSISNKGIQESTTEKNWLSVSNPTDEEKNVCGRIITCLETFSHWVNSIPMCPFSRNSRQKMIPLSA